MSAAPLDDVDRIMAVMEVAFDPEFGEAWTRRQVEDALALPGNFYLLAGEDGLEPLPNRPATGFVMSRAALDEEELLLLGVMPHLRRRGIGTMLVERFAAAAAHRNARRLLLEMRDGNPAERLYLRAGFEKIGRRRDYYRRGSRAPIDAITFARGNLPQG